MSTTEIIVFYLSGFGTLAMVVGAFGLLDGFSGENRGARRVVVASYLLADGLFQDRMRASGADVVTDPLGTHPGVVRLIASRFRRARLPVAA